MTKSTTSTSGHPQPKANAKSNNTSFTTTRKPKSVGAEAASPDNATPDGEPAVIVFGKDEAGKAHASWFTEADAELAIKAAAMMAFRILQVSSPDIRAKALALPTGRIFASGKGFVPFCKMAAYEALSGFKGAFQPPMPAEAQPAEAPVATSTPQRWDDIGVGALVLATTETPVDGWFESIVTEDRGEGLFLLRWRDWPDDDMFVRRSEGLALLPERSAQTSAESR